MNRERLAKKQVNTHQSVLHDFTATEVAQAAEFLWILNNPASLPLERDLADIWFRRVFLTQNNRAFREAARLHYASLRNAREV